MNYIIKGVYLRKLKLSRAPIAYSGILDEVKIDSFIFTYINRKEI